MKHRSIRSPRQRGSPAFWGMLGGSGCGLSLVEGCVGSLAPPFTSLLGAEDLFGEVIMISVSEFGFFFVAPVDDDWAISKPDPFATKAAAINTTNIRFICPSH
jgi:hypothetical protein